ncbi:MAG: hypothetical protein M3014_07065 [Chloroflexota bacterium]|nr:hypothetical protein [Chloroflexota bacterium]
MAISTPNRPVNNQGAGSNSSANSGASAGPSAIPAGVMAQRGERRVTLLRSFMLAFVSASIAFGSLAGIVAWQGNVATSSDYHTIVDEGSVSVDAALRSRAAALDQMSAAATYLETAGQARQAAAQAAARSWDEFNTQARISWRNISDPTHGEANVFSAADTAATDYIQQIGAMFSYAQSGDNTRAGSAFLAARETMNTHLVPALGGLEAVKVEKMEATYARADLRIGRWSDTILWVGLLLALVLLLMLAAVRRMHYRWSPPIVGALVATLLLTLSSQTELRQAINDAGMLVREAYDNVAGVQDTAALLSQERALSSILVFDPVGTSSHLADFAQYNTLFEQRLCGPQDCTAKSFVNGNDSISPDVVTAAMNEKSKLGLPHIPLVANVFFAGQAAEYEKLRQDYRNWLATHDKLASQVKLGQLSSATALSTGESAQIFSSLKADTDAATATARTEFDNIWKREYTATSIGGALSLLFPISGLAAAWGLWQRRRELSL